MRKILVVDDSKLVSRHIRELIEGTDFEICGQARTGKQAVALYESLRPDIVTMDIVLPDEDGVDVAERLIEEYPSAKIVVISSLANLETEKRLAKVGITSYAFKPITKETLLTALEMAQR